jgi:hypothetical protein
MYRTAPAKLSVPRPRAPFWTARYDPPWPTSKANARMFAGRRQHASRQALRFASYGVAGSIRFCGLRFEHLGRAAFAERNATLRGCCHRDYLTEREARAVGPPRKAPPPCALVFAPAEPPAANILRAIGSPSTAGTPRRTGRRRLGDSGGRMLLGGYRAARKVVLRAAWSFDP